MTREQFLNFARAMHHNYQMWMRDTFTLAYDNAKKVDEHDPVLATLIREHADNCAAIRDHLRAKLLESEAKPKLES